MPKSDHTRNNLLSAGLLLLVAAVVFKCAWVGDDAYISLRTVDNLLEGRGLTWNAGERVQLFTHPLWLLLVTGVHAVIPDGYWSLILASLITSLAAVAIVIWRLAASPVMAALAVGVLLVSKWWVDYATSGLENPLLYLLAGLFVLGWSRPDEKGSEISHGGEGQILQLTLIASVAVMTRPDSLLLFGPPLLMRARNLGRRAWRPLLLGLLPLVLWEIFAVVWFGFPVANTAYAKLTTGLPVTLLAGQGLRYLGYSVLADPVLGLTLVVGALAMLRRPRTDLAFLVGIGLYLLYVVRIGGCFMGGRFLTLPFFFTVCLLVRRPPPARSMGWIVAGVLALSLLVPRNPITCRWDYQHTENHAGIADERGHYFPTTGAWLRLDGDFEEHIWILDGRRDRALAATKGSQGYRLIRTIGFYAYEVGPQVHVVDPYGLASPFLARLPVNPTGYEGGWRIGHFHRDWPDGYEASLASGKTQLADPVLGRLYDDVELVTTGPLFSRARWAAIWRLNSRWPLNPVN